MTLDYYKAQLKETAEKLSEFKKGILAVDESTKTIGKRLFDICLLYTSPSPRDGRISRMPSSA